MPDSTWVVVTQSVCWHAAAVVLQFTAYMKEIKAQEQEAARLDAVFPCVLEVRVARDHLGI